MVDCYKCDSGTSGSTKYVVPERAQYVGLLSMSPQLDPSKWPMPSESVTCTDRKELRRAGYFLYPEQRGPVKNAFSFRDGSFLVETQYDKLSRKLVQKLQAVYPLVVERLVTVDTTRHVIFCSQVERCCDKKMWVKLAKQFVRC